jgi:hypothetical protein
MSGLRRPREPDACWARRGVLFGPAVLRVIGLLTKVRGVVGLVGRAFRLLLVRLKLALVWFRSSSARQAACSASSAGWNVLDATKRRTRRRRRLLIVHVPRKVRLVVGRVR